VNAFLPAPIAHLSPTFVLLSAPGWKRFEIQEFLSAMSSSFNFSRNEIEPAA